MTPFGRGGWRKASFAEAEFGSFPVSSARVSSNKEGQREPAHLVVFVLVIPILPTVEGSKVYAVSERLIADNG